MGFAQPMRNQARLKQFYDESAVCKDEKQVVSRWQGFCKTQAAAYLPAICCWNRVLNKLNRIFNNLLVKLFVRRAKKRVAMNLVRCDAHREVLQTVLEIEVFKS